MADALCQEAIRKSPRNGLNIQRRIVLLLIRFQQVRLLAFLGWLRRKQLENK